MKLIIDIPEDIYKPIIEAYKNDKELQTRPNLYMAVANGIPFEDREKGELTDEEVISYCNKHGYVICSQAVIDDPERERYRIQFAGYVGVDGEEIKPNE